MSNLAVYMANTNLYIHTTAARTVRFFSADCSTTNAPCKYDFTTSSFSRGPLSPPLCANTRYLPHNGAPLLFIPGHALTQHH